MNFTKVRFLTSVHALRQLPEPDFPEVAFAGRSNVGKSSLINTVIGRKGMVKTSARPGKTQGLNYFVVNESMYFVDLPGYGFARVAKQVQAGWQQLITEYLLGRKTLQLVIVIVDLRHPLKKMDRELMDWLRYQEISYLPVYTKADKLSNNNQLRNAAALDSALGILPEDRLIFSSKTGQGRTELQRRLALNADSC
ncbi:MAG TPA: YihA family ribosome biogenesis GTP-binding protein [Desulfobulbus sp.]|nr:YihA family ribosome biogenesis GTP-binding protein [Desulfobulbus sp.]